MFWLGIATATTVLSIVLGLTFSVLGLYVYLRIKYLHNVVRIFQEKPLFIIPRGQPVRGAEEVRLTTSDGLSLTGCYLRTSAPIRKAVILFGLEYGSNCWSCVPYCDYLLGSGFDIFTFESRNQGTSEVQRDYDPLQWVTNFEVIDFQAAVAFLKARPDADPNGIGFFGISKGGSAGIIAASRDAYIRCCVTDGIFATYTTMVPYMRKWVSIYSNRYFLQLLMPSWLYGLIGRAALKQIAAERRCRFPHLERAIAKLSPRPLLMIHGGGDTYIKPDMAKSLFRKARQPKELWLVEGAKHNQALQIAGDEYRRRVLDFFQNHLANGRDGARDPALANRGTESTTK